MFISPDLDGHRHPMMDDDGFEQQGGKPSEEDHHIRGKRAAVHKQHTQKSNKHQCVGGIVKFRLSEVSAGVGDGLLIASAW